MDDPREEMLRVEMPPSVEEHEVWGNTSAVATYFASQESRNEALQEHWNTLVRQINVLLSESKRLKGLHRRYEELAQLKREQDQAVDSLRAVMNLKPHGEQTVLLRRKLGKLRHHAKLVDRLTTECQEHLWGALEGAYLRESESK